VSATDVLTAFRQRDITLIASGGTIRYRAPAGVVTADDRAALRAHKAELLALLAPPEQTPANGKEETASPHMPTAPVAAPRRRAPKESFSQEAIPTAACPRCDRRAWRLRTTPSTGGAWLWACAACADAVQAATAPK